MAEQEHRARARIKVIGVGGAGCHVIEHMIQEGPHGVEFICANTNAESLSRSNARTKVLLDRGHGTAGRPELGRDLALAARGCFTEVLKGADTVFIVAGMGGGTGTCVAPVVAEVASELGIVTLAAVATPFEFEGRRMNVAWKGINELDRHADAVILFPNEGITEALGGEISMRDAFSFIDRQIEHAIEGIARVVNAPGLINIDIADVCSMMNGVGLCVVGSGTASGPDRARLAAQEALYFPSMRVIQPLNRRRVLVSIAASRTVGLDEVGSVFRAIRDQAADDATILGGATYDESMVDRLSVSVIAAGWERLNRL